MIAHSYGKHYTKAITNICKPRKQKSPHLLTINNRDNLDVIWGFKMKILMIIISVAQSLYYIFRHDIFRLNSSVPTRPNYVADLVRNNQCNLFHRSTLFIRMFLGKLLTVSIKFFTAIYVQASSSSKSSPWYIQFYLVRSQQSEVRNLLSSTFLTRKWSR